MTRTFKVLDLFAGPGGLAEGFSSVRRNGRRVFEIALSVEKDRAAASTLRLRSFTRQFDSIPDAYYRMVEGSLTIADLADLHPAEWKAAEREALQLELATAGADAIIDPLVDELRRECGNDTVLVGGPPCQAYSLAGRARNRGKADYVPEEDHRHYLYREYIRLLDRLRPAAFVMENVKGFLSSSVDGARIFEKVMADLATAGGGPDSYLLLPLAPTGRRGGARHVVAAEQFGIPQRRHRVIIVGIRSDLVDDPEILAKALADGLVPALASSVEDAIGAMPRVRSGLSDAPDSTEAWKLEAADAFGDAAAAAFAEEDELYDRVAARLLSLAEDPSKLPDARASTTPATVRGNRLAAWLVDPRLGRLPNHETRSHMGSDLARYAFAACFAAITGHSPKARDFPTALAPAHRNWTSGKFADRFRVQCLKKPATTITSHIAKDGHYFIHPDAAQCRSLTVREAARIQTFPDNYLFLGNRTEQYTQVGNAVPPLLAAQIAEALCDVLGGLRASGEGTRPRPAHASAPSRKPIDLFDERSAA